MNVYVIPICEFVIKVLQIYLHCIQILTIQLHSSTQIFLNSKAISSHITNTGLPLACDAHPIFLFPY